MLQDRIEPDWLAAFETVLRRCALAPGDTVAILCESQSRRVLVDLAHLAASRLGAQCFTLTLPSLFDTTTPIQRSTGACHAIRGLAPVVEALAGCHLVLDCTVEGLMHAPELPAILKGRGDQRPRVLYISNEHPEALMRLLPDEQTEGLVKRHIAKVRATQRMHVRSDAGTDLHIALQGAAVGGNWGYTTRPGTLSHWPGGLVLAFPAAHSVHGRLVLAPGDVNLTFKRYIESPITLTIDDDHITAIDGTGVDADLMRSYISAWADGAEDRGAYAVSHVGYGLAAGARWDSMALYDKRDFNGTELRAFAGNFLYSTGANEVAGRFTQGHFDLPMRHCTVTLDDTVVVERGVLGA